MFVFRTQALQFRLMHYTQPLALATGTAARPSAARPTATTPTATWPTAHDNNDDNDDDYTVTTPEESETCARPP